MAKCRWCGRGGLFRAVDNNGLCRDCQHIVPEIAGHIRVLKESVELARGGKTFATRLSRTDVATKHAQELLQYERAGVPTLSPEPSELLDMLGRHRRELVEDEIRTITDKALEKSQLASTARTKERALATAVLKVREVVAAAGYGDDVSSTQESSLHSEIHRVKLDAFVDAARKAEFKGNTKKAIDQYQEALFFLRNDEIRDADQERVIGEIETKLKELQAI